jgi:hypothetical protein
MFFHIVMPTFDLETIMKNLILATSATLFLLNPVVADDTRELEEIRLEEIVITGNFGDEPTYEADEYVFPKGVVSEIFCTQYKDEDVLNARLQPTHGKYGIYVKTTKNSFTSKQIAEGKVEPVVGVSEVTFFSIGKTPAEYQAEVTALRNGEPCVMYSSTIEDTSKLVRECSLDDALADLQGRGWLGATTKQSYGDFVAKSANLPSLIKAHQAAMPGFIEENVDFHVIATNSFPLQTVYLSSDEEGGQAGNDPAYDGVYGDFWEVEGEPEYNNIPKSEKLANPFIGFSTGDYYSKAEKARFEDGYEAQAGFAFGRVVEDEYQEEEEKGFTVKPGYTLKISQLGDCSYICKDCVEDEE